MKKYSSSVWNWYKKYNISVATFLLALQSVHLLWLTTDVVMPALGIGGGVLSNSTIELFLVLIDFLEIPAIITTSIVYLSSFARDRYSKHLWYFFLINIQWIHLFWITDEMIIHGLRGGIGGWPPLIAWIAILIDYLEIPVIVENVRQFMREKIYKF